MKIDISEKQLQMLVDDVVHKVKEKMRGGDVAEGNSGLKSSSSMAFSASPSVPTARSLSKTNVLPTNLLPTNLLPTNVTSANVTSAGQVGSSGAVGSSLSVGSSLTASKSEGVFGDMDEAVASAQASYEQLMDMSVKQREGLISAMRRAAIENAERLGKLAVEETGFGRVSSKIQKILLAARKTPGTEDLNPRAYSGDDGLTLVEPAPYGVIGSITPSTNPPSTVVNNSIGIVAAGNGVVVNPHPSAKVVSNETVKMLNRAILAAGGPPTLVCSVTEPTLKSGQAMMKHAGVRLLLVTGGEGVVKVAMSSGKKVIAAGPGNPPVIVDDTADITRAARNIVDGASFDNNVLCTAEKEVFVYKSVAERLKQEMCRYGAYEISGHQLDALVNECIDIQDPSHPRARTDKVGKDASLLLSYVGINAPKNTRLVIAEVDDPMHPLVQAEQLMPFLPIVRVNDLNEALSCALQAEHGFRHTAVMHSEHVSRMSTVARAVETSIFVKNAPSYAGLGFGGEGHTTLSIATPTGEGLTSARTFTRQRRCVLAGAFRII